MISWTLTFGTPSSAFPKRGPVLRIGGGRILASHMDVGPHGTGIESDRPPSQLMELKRMKLG